MSSANTVPATVPERPRRPRIIEVMNLIVLILSVLLIVFISVDTFKKVNFSGEPFLYGISAMGVHFLYCRFLYGADL